MDLTTKNTAWETLSPEEKKRALYERQKAMLATFLEHGAITQAQHDKSLHDMTEKMGYGAQWSSFDKGSKNEYN